MPTNYCLNCTAKADYHCGCCGGVSHYCGAACQKADWVRVHRFEKRVFATGDSVLVDTHTEPVPVGQRDVKPRRQQSEQERQEYSTIVARILEAHAATPVPKGVRRLTHAQRGQLKWTLQGIAPSVEARRNEFQAKFTQTVATLVKTVRPLHAVPFGQEEETQMGVLFRRRDLLHVKQTLAMATASVDDATEARRYAAQIEDGERRFIHRLLFQEQVSYAEVLVVQQTALTDARLERTLDVILERAFVDTVETCVRYLQSPESASTEPWRFAQPFTGDGGDTDPGEARTRRVNLENLMGALAEPAESGTVFSMTHLDSVATVAQAVFTSRQDDAAEQGQISAEQRDNSNSFLSRLWDTLADTLRPVAESTRKSSRALYKRIRAAVSERVQEVKDALSNLQIARVFLVLSTISFLLLCYGLFTYSYSTDAQFDKLDAQVGKLTEYTERTGDLLSLQSADIAREKAAVDALTQTLDRREQKAFVALDAQNDNLESATNRIVVSQSMNKIAQTAERIAVARMATNPRARSIKEMQGIAEDARAIQTAENYNDKREALEDLQASIKDYVQLGTDTGFAHSLAEVDKMLEDRRQFVETMGQSTDAIGKSLDKQVETLGETRTTLLNAREVARTTSSGAPFLTTMLKATGYEYYMDPSLLSPMAEVEAKHMGYSTTPNAFIMSGLQFMGQVEHNMHKVVRAANVFRSGVGWMRFIGSLAWSCFSMDYATVLFHALTGISMLYENTRAVLQSERVQGLVSSAMRTIGQSALFNTLTSVFKYGDTRYDEELRPIVDAIKAESGESVEARVEAAFRRYNAGELGKWTEAWGANVKYGRLIELLYDRESVYAGNALLNGLTVEARAFLQAGLQPAIFLSRLIGAYYMSFKYVDLFWQLLYIMQWLWGALNWWNWAGVPMGQGLFVAAVILGANLYNRPRSTAPWYYPETVVEALLAPVAAMVKLVWRRPYEVMTATYVIYATLSAVDTGTGVIKWLGLGPSDAEQEAHRQGFAKPATHLYERAVAERELGRVLREGQADVDDVSEALRANGVQVEKISVNMTSVIGDLLIQADGSAGTASVIQRFTKLIYDSAATVPRVEV